MTQAYFRKWGIYYYQMIDSDGALELHPSLGIADIIVDLTSSGTTLKDNRLREIDGGTVLDSASCLIGHAPSLSALAGEGETGPLALLLDAMDGVRASEGWLHLEVVGSPAAPGRETAATVAAYLRDQGAQHIWPRRGLGRPRRTRLARHRPGRRQEAHRLPAPLVRTRRRPGRRPPRPVRLRPRRAFDVRPSARAVGRSGKRRRLWAGVVEWKS